MKLLITTTLTLLLTIASFGQVAMTFDEAMQNNISFTTLDSLYKSGIHSDPSLAVFSSNQEEYVDAYKKLLQELSGYLKQHGFIWEKATKGFNRIYFDKGGSIDYFLYMFRPNQLTKEQEDIFKELLTEFIKGYRFALTAEVGFAQCSPVTYLPQR